MDDIKLLDFSLLLSFVKRVWYPRGYQVYFLNQSCNLKKTIYILDVLIDGYFVKVAAS